MGDLMNRSRWLRPTLTLAVMAIFGVVAVQTAPSSMHFGGMWPVGLASGALLVTPRALTAYVAALIALVATLTFEIADYPLDVAIGYGVAIAVSAEVVHQVVTADRTRRLHLRNNADFGRYMLACGLGAATSAVGFTVVSATAQFGTPWKVGVAALAGHAAAQVVTLGLFKESTHHVGEYGRVERWVAWTETVVITTIAFIPTEVPSLAFLVIPILGWVALRAPMLEALAQLAVVTVISVTLTVAGHGPFADPFLNRHLDPEFRLLPLQAFLIACAMMTVPFSMSVWSQRRSAAQVLMERARSDRLVQSARGIAIIGTDELGRINLFSPGAELILGYTPDEVFGHSTRLFHTQAEIVRQADELGCPPTYIEVVRATAQLPAGTPREWEFIRKDGRARWLSTILSPIVDDSGAFLGYVATADDITDRLETQSALEAALLSEREAVQRLTEIDEVKDRFVSSVSHELRTPITNIVGFLELLMDGVYGEPTEEQSRAMTRIDMNSRRLLSLIDDLLTLSSLETLNQPRELVPVDLVAVLWRAEEIVRPGLMRRDLHLEVDAPTRPVMVRGDSGQLERLVINLATNAIKFTLDGGRVTLRLRPGANGSGPSIEVADTGIGIPEADQEMLFSRFFRATQARAAAVPGSGLGLSIAKSIAELHGARISATSVYGVGSTFRVEFPVRVAESASEVAADQR